MKVTLGLAAIAIACIVALAGTAGYFVWRSFERHGATEAAALREIDAVRARFGARPPLIEINDPKRMDVRINRLASTDGARVTTIHVVSWKAEDGEIVRTEMPIWLMRFSSVNILSQLGVTPAQIRLTVDDIQRYGPGVVVDYKQPEAVRVLVWVD
jgi:hypothetical protein